MNIKKGTLLNVKHSRLGSWKGIAIRDFDTTKETFYPIVLAQEQTVEGISTYWEMGELMPCKNSLCKIEII